MGQGKAFADMKPEGEINHLIKSVCKKLQKNKSAAVIADQRQVGSYDAEQIYKVYSAGGCWVNQRTNHIVPLKLQKHVIFRRNMA